MPALTLSLREVAAELGLSPGRSGTAGRQRVLRLIRAKKLRAVQVGKEFRVARSEVERFAAGEPAA